VVPAFESQQVIFKCNHLNGSFLAVLHYKAVCVSILSKMITVPIIPVFSPNGDKHLISPYNFTTRSYKEATRIKEMITSGEIS